ncbi:MAG: type II toxin-antitoxin system Phd/YefM family antitoxin [Lacisediminihabitans sp.]
MASIAHRELRNNSSAILRDVQSGETILVTNHGKVVAVMSPPAASLVSGPQVREATIHGGFSELPRITLDHPIQQTLDELRGER